MSEKLKGWALLRAAVRNRKTSAMLVLGFASGLPFVLLIARDKAGQAHDPPLRPSLEHQAAVCAFHASLFFRDTSASPTRLSTAALAR